MGRVSSLRVFSGKYLRTVVIISDFLQDLKGKQNISGVLRELTGLKQSRLVSEAIQSNRQKHSGMVPKNSQECFSMFCSI